MDNKVVEKKYIERFHKRYIIKDNGCWNWIGNLNKGYGQINFNGSSNGAHRLSYLIYFGEIPKNKLVLHKCDNPQCVNPNHLEIGDYVKNAIDCVKRQRHPWAKLNLRIAKTIRKEYKLGNTSTRKLAKKYGICHTGIFRLIKGVYYND